MILKRPLLAAFAILTACAVVGIPPARAELQTEELTREQLPDRLPAHWVWVNDISFTRMLDGRAYLLDADTGTFKGMVMGGYAQSMLQLLPGGDHFTVPATFYSRGTRGERTDVITIYDSKTLSPGDEIIIPAKRFNGLPFIGALPLTDDGRFSLIYNFTPDQSVTVVDLPARKVVGEYHTPGCGLIYPTGNRRFFMQCGDGALQAASIGDDGHITLGQLSPKLFDQDDPATEKPVRVGPSQWLLFTFKNQVHVIDGGGPVPDRKAVWSLTDAATAGWSIGGTQPAAYHAPSGHLYALMHEGGANTHKNPGSEVWVYDVKAHKLLKRIRLDGTATAIAVSGDDQPLLYTVMAGVEDFVIYDAVTGTRLRSIGGLGPTLSYIQPVPVAPAGGGR